MEHKLYIARFVLEAQSPVMIAGGDEDPLLDVLLSRDVNGLPVLPATSLAGAVRNMFCKSDADLFFGQQQDDTGTASKLVFTDGLYHLADDKPRDGVIYNRTDLAKDCVWEIGQRTSPVHRDHVHLNAHGVVNGDGKFERAAAPTGSRFTFEISQRGEDGTALKAAAAQVKRGLFLGGATRSGYGELACIRAGIEVLDLKTDRKRYCELARQTLAERNILADDIPPPERTKWDIKGQIEGPLLAGAASENSEFDRSFFEESRIIWAETGAKIADMAILPGSAIKGALRHRTLFHLHLLRHDDADKALEQVFGHAKTGEGGQAGILRFSDVEISDVAMFTMTHVGLDRFTGGSRNGVLFRDQMIWRPKLAFQVEPLKDWPCALCRNAFIAALTDLKNGALGIGADWGDGVGVFESLEIPDLNFSEVGA